MTDELPLFPLNAVLFPGMTLPLHIFEPRYRLMIGRCIQLNRPFGIVLIREGLEVGGPSVPYQVGTSAHITHVERLPDGCMNIEVVGEKRFRIKEYTQEQPYLIGRVEDFPVNETDHAGTSPLVHTLSPMLRRYLKTLIEVIEVNVTIDEFPDDSLALAYFTAILVPFPMKDKQEILEMASVRDMLVAEYVMLKREVMLLDLMIERQSSGADGLVLFSPN
jgi:Lon protease-like protein